MTQFGSPGLPGYGSIEQARAAANGNQYPAAQGGYPQQPYQYPQPPYAAPQQPRQGREAYGYGQPPYYQPSQGGNPDSTLDELLDGQQGYYPQDGYYYGDAPAQPAARKRWTWVVTGVSLVAIAGAVAAFRYLPIHFSGNESDDAAPPRPVPTHVHNPNIRNHPTKTKPTTKAPLPVKYGTLTQGAIPCGTALTVSTPSGGMDIPMMQSVDLIGDTTRYNFTDGPNADFVVHVVGSIPIKVCMNKAGLFTANDATQDQPGTQTFSGDISKVPLQPDFTQLQITPTWSNPQKLLYDLCLTQKAQAQKNASQHPTATSSPVPPPAPTACVEYQQYNPAKPDDLTPYLTQIENNTLKKEVTQVAASTEGLLLQIIDKQFANDLTKGDEAFIRNAFLPTSPSVIAQIKKQQASAPGVQLKAPQVNLDLTGSVPLLGQAYFAEHADAKQELTTVLTAALENQLKDYLAQNPKTDRSLTNLLAILAQQGDVSQLPTFSIDDRVGKNGLPTDYVSSLTAK